MWCWIELVMAWFNRLGTRTCRTSPTKEATSEVMKIPLWAPMMGMTRRSQVQGRSGSMVARGASLRATSAMGTNRVPASAVPGWAGAGDGASSSAWRSGPAGRHRTRAARQARPSKARSASAWSPRRPAISRQPGVDRGVGRRPASVGRGR